MTETESVADAETEAAPATETVVDEALMARLEARWQDACACGSGEPLGECCGPALRGDQAPETAVACLRARYSAYVVEAVDFIVETHHPDTRGELSRESVQSWSAESEWLSLDVLAEEDGGPEDDDGLVRFRARYRQKGYVFEHLEHAQFRRHEGRWCFLDAETPPHRNEQRKVGRNDPCPCGSEKKYKRCCGK